jgi:uncharacterized membrane protein HdeD (DUF308 family)
MQDENAAKGEAARRAAPWVTVFGVVMIAAGVLAVLAPAPAALAATVFFGVTFIVAGAAEIAHAFATRVEGGVGWKLLSGVATLVLGILFAAFPVAGIATLALLVGALLFAHGIGSGMLAFKLKPRRGWGWVLFDAAVSIVLAILVAAGWPATSIGIVGLLTGFALISAGVWRIMLARLLRQAPGPGS